MNPSEQPPPALSDGAHAPPEEDRRYHTYTTHYIPWFVRVMWIVFWIGMVWYLIKFAIPMAKNYF